MTGSVLLGVIAPSPALAWVLILGALLLWMKGATMIRFDTDGIENYATDHTLEASSGVWIDFGDRRFLILRAGGANHRFTRRIGEMIRPLRRQIANGTVDPDKLRKIYWRVYAEAVVKDWDGIKSGGNPVPYSAEAGYAFFEAFPDLFEELRVYADDMSTFAEERIADAVETLGNSSSTEAVSAKTKRP